jgi:ketosteroid isomerase-like protein
MKKKTMIALFGLSLSTISFAQTQETKEIKQVITSFSSAGDRNDAVELEKHLDDNYRIVMNRLFGSKEVSIMPKSAYLEKIRSKEFGGDKREVVIENVLINGNTASAKITFTGAKMKVVSLIFLIKNEEGLWKIVCDLPTIV